MSRFRRACFYSIMGVTPRVQWLLNNVITIFNNLTVGFGVREVVDIAVVTIALYMLLKLTMQTRARQVFKGMLYLIAIAWLAQAFQLSAVSWILNNALMSGAIAIVVIFQPELRRALEQIGRGTAIERVLTRADSDEMPGAKVVEHLVAVLLNLSRRKVGGLIIIEGKTGLRDVMETGTMVDAVISAALIENIFEPNTPLHDGAIVLRGKRVATAGCVLPLTDAQEISRELGTRHRAALGITEVSDAVALIVSEETGVVSYAKGGKLTRYLDKKRLNELLRPLYVAEQQSGLFGAFVKRRAETRGDEDA